MSKKRSRRKKKTATRNIRETKKEAVLGTNKKSPVPIIALIGCGVLIVAGAVFWVLKSPSTPYPGGGNRSAQKTASQIIYPVSQFQDHKARHFEYRDKNHTIKYFILKSSDGVIRAAFDACDVCWPAGKGYYQDGDHMVCRNCGRRFASVLVNEVKGGCNPAPLNRQVQGEKLVIEIQDILEGKMYFNFS